MKSISKIIAILALISVATALDLDDLVDNKLLGSGFLKHAAAFSLDGTSKTTSPDFTVKDKAVRQIISWMDGKQSILDRLINLGGDNYRVDRAQDERLVFGWTDKQGFAAIRSREILIIGVFEGRESRDDEYKDAFITIRNVSNSLLEQGY